MLQKIDGISLNNAEKLYLRRHLAMSSDWYLGALFVSSIFTPHTHHSCQESHFHFFFSWDKDKVQSLLYTNIPFWSSQNSLTSFQMICLLLYILLVLFVFYILRYNNPFFLLGTKKVCNKPGMCFKPRMEQKSKTFFLLKAFSLNYFIIVISCLRVWALCLHFIESSLQTLHHIQSNIF